MLGLHDEDEKMSVPDTAVSMAATWSYPCTPQGRKLGHTRLNSHADQLEAIQPERDQS